MPALRTPHTGDPKSVTQITGKASASAEINGGGMLTLKGGMVKIN
jgi:hypothetical protein